MFRLGGLTSRYIRPRLCQGRLHLMNGELEDAQRIESWNLVPDLQSSPWWFQYFDHRRLNDLGVHFNQYPVFKKENSILYDKHIYKYNYILCIYTHIILTESYGNTPNLVVNQHMFHQYWKRNGHHSVPVTLIHLLGLSVWKDWMTVLSTLQCFEKHIYIYNSY